MRSSKHNKLKTSGQIRNYFAYHHKGFPNSIRDTNLLVPYTRVINPNVQRKQNLGHDITKIIWETTNVPSIQKIAQNCDIQEQNQDIND